MKTNYSLITLILVTALLLAGCGSNPRVGELQTESQSVELGVGEAGPVSVDIEFGAGELAVTGGGEKLLESHFTYNVDKLKPEVKYADGTLSVRQPEAEGLPDLRNITDFRNEWDLRLNSDVPMTLSLNMGAGNSDLQLADLSLTGLDITLGAGNSTVDLSGDWARDLDVTMHTGAANVIVRLPGDTGVRVEVDSGPTIVNAPDLTKNGNVYTNDAYGVSEATLNITIETGIGQINLEEVEHSQAKAVLQNLLDRQVEMQNIPGMVMAVRLADGSVIWDTAGYTGPSGKERWNAHTPSLIASVTKTFTAVVVMQLVEEGKLSLNDTVDTWFPEQPNGDRITIRMLLSHTSSLADYKFVSDIEKWTRAWTPEDLIAEANKAGPVGEPGSCVAVYSNANYIMLGRIIEKVTGNSWAQEVESRIIQPLGLKDTTWATDENRKEVALPGYIKTSDGYLSSDEFPWYPHSSTA